jgi:V8-like Glu-specific endopeptidase
MKDLTKAIALAMSLCMVGAMTVPIGADAATTTYLQGDVNGNGKVDSVDLTNLKQFLLGKKSADGKIADRLDVDGDGIIGQNDVKTLSTMILNGNTKVSVSYKSTVALPTQEDRYYYVFSASSGKMVDTYTLDSDDAPTITSSSASTRGIIGDDDRTLETSLKGVVNIGNNGTGFIIGEHTILTAAHCVCNRSEQVGNSGMKIYLYDNGSYNNASVTATPVQIHVPGKYIDTEGYGEYDYAIITVKEDLSDYMSFNLGVARSTAVGDEIKVTGNGWGGTGVNTDLIGVMSTGVGDILTVSDYYVTYTADTIGGDSGAPLYYTKDGVNTVIGIHNSGGTGFNSAIRITTDILQFAYNNSYID